MDIMITKNYYVVSAIIVAKYALIHHQSVRHVIKIIMESSKIENDIVFTEH